MVNHKVLIFSIILLAVYSIPLSGAVDTNQNQSYQPTPNEELAFFIAFSILIICVILYYSIKDKDEFSAIYSRWHLTEAEKETKIEKIKKYNKDNKKKRKVIRLVCYVISITIVIFFPWIFVNRVTAEIIMVFGTFFIQVYGLSGFLRSYEKHKIIAWGLLLGSDVTALIFWSLVILMSLISPDWRWIGFPVVGSLIMFGFAIKFSKGEPLSDNPFGHREGYGRVGFVGFGGSFGGGFGGGSSGGGGHSGKW